METITKLSQIHSKNNNWINKNNQRVQMPITKHLCEINKCSSSSNSSSIVNVVVYQSPLLVADL